VTAQFDKITIWIDTFIPEPQAEAFGMCFHGDDRGFSSDYNEQRYRTRSEITVSGFLANAPEETDFHQCGESQKLDCATGEILETATAATDGMSFHDFRVGNTFPDPNGGVIDNPNEFCANFLYDAAAANPLAPASPDADSNFFFTIDPVGRTVSFTGATNAYPNYEIYARVDDGPTVVLFQRQHAEGPISGLPGGADQPASGTASV
jgi:hypothetical protein